MALTLIPHMDVDAVYLDTSTDANASLTTFIRVAARLMNFVTNPYAHIYSVNNSGIRALKDSPGVPCRSPITVARLGQEILASHSTKPLVIVADKTTVNPIHASLTAYLWETTAGIDLKVMDFDAFLDHYSPNSSLPRNVLWPHMSAAEASSVMNPVLVDEQPPPHLPSELGLTEKNVDLIEVVTAKAGAGKDVTFVQLRATIGDVTFLVEGTARRDPRDAPDAQLGLTLATARALQSLATKIERRASGRIKHNEDTLEIQRGQRAQRQRRGAEGQALGRRRAARRAERARELEANGAPVAYTKSLGVGSHAHTADREG